MPLFKCTLLYPEKIALRGAYGRLQNFISCHPTLHGSNIRYHMHALLHKLELELLPFEHSNLRAVYFNRALWPSAQNVTISVSIMSLMYYLKVSPMLKKSTAYCDKKKYRW